MYDVEVTKIFNNIYQIQKNLGKDIADDIIIKLFEKDVLNIKNAKLSYEFAKNIAGADVLAHGKVVIDSGNPEWNYWFAHDIAGADIKAHEKVVIDSKDLVYNFCFARDIEGADVLAHGKVIVDSKNLEYNVTFMLKIKGADIEAHKKAIIDIIANIKKFNKGYKYNRNGNDTETCLVKILSLLNP